MAPHLKKREKVGPRLKNGKIIDNCQLFTLTIPGLIILFLFSYLPMYGLVLAFKDFKFNLGIWGSEWVGLKNFKFIFQSDLLGRMLRNTLGLNFLFLVVNTTVTVVLSLLLYEVTNRIAIKAIQTVIFLPFVVSWTAASYALYANLSEVNGIINSVLEFFGKDPVSWYSVAEYWPKILLVCYLWKQIGYGTIIYYGNLTAMDKALFEAADLDGANRLQKMWHLSIPHIKPIVLVFFILSLGHIFSADFGMFYYLPKNSPFLYETTDVIDTYIYRALRVTGDTGMSTAMGLLQSVLGVTVLLISNKISSWFNDGNGGAVL